MQVPTGLNCYHFKSNFQNLCHPIQHRLVVLLSKTYQSRPRQSQMINRGGVSGNEFIIESTIVKNPIAQAFVKHLHFSCGNQLHVLIYFINGWQPIELAHNPSQLTCGMDMIFRQHVKIDWQLLKFQCRSQAIAYIRKENQT